MERQNKQKGNGTGQHPVVRLQGHVRTLLPMPRPCSVPHAPLARVPRHSNVSCPTQSAHPHASPRHPNITSIEKRRRHQGKVTEGDRGERCNTRSTFETFKCNTCNIYVAESPNLMPLRSTCLPLDTKYSRKNTKLRSSIGHTPRENPKIHILHQDPK